MLAGASIDNRRSRRSIFRRILEFTNSKFHTIDSHTFRSELARVSPRLLVQADARLGDSDPDLDIQLRSLTDFEPANLIRQPMLARNAVRSKADLGSYLNQVLHNAAFQSLEAAWRGKEKLHHRGYFHHLMANNQEIDESLGPLLRLSRENIVRLRRTEAALVRSLRRDPLLTERVKRLMSIPALGPITALTWVLELGDVKRFPSIKRVISYCGLCGPEVSSAGTAKRTPISK